MTPSELADLLSLHGHHARVRGQEVLLEVCWFCGNDRWNLEMNAPKGVWHCWACRSSGRLDALLRRHLGEDANVPVHLGGGAASHTQGHTAAPEVQTRPVPEVPSAARWLARRGLPEHVADRYGLQVCVEEGHRLHTRILLPAHDFWRPGEILGWDARAYVPGMRPKYLTTLPGRTLTGHRTRDPRPCLVVEGPFDGLAVHRAGFQAAVLGGTSSTEEEALAARLPPEVPLVVLLDGDADVEARRLLHRLRVVRPATELRLLPPGVDPGELRPEVLRKLIDERC